MKLKKSEIYLMFFDDIKKREEKWNEKIFNFKN